MAASWLGTLGAKPPSSPLAVDMPWSWISFLSIWNTSAPQRSASRKLAAPTGRSSVPADPAMLLACAPPLMTFIIGTGISWRPLPPEITVQRQGPTRRSRRARPPCWRPAWHWRPGVPLLSVPSVRSGAIDEGLFLRVQAHQGFGDLGVEILHRPQHALARIAALVAVAQFDGLARSLLRRRRHGGATHRADSSSTSHSTVGFPTRIE